MSDEYDRYERCREDNNPDIYDNNVDIDDLQAIVITLNRKAAEQQKSIDALTKSVDFLCEAIAKHESQTFDCEEGDYEGDESMRGFKI